MLPSIAPAMWMRGWKICLSMQVAVGVAALLPLHLWSFGEILNGAKFFLDVIATGFRIKVVDSGFEY